MTCQDGAKAFYDSLKIHTDRVNRDKIKLSSRRSSNRPFLRPGLFFFFVRFVERFEAQQSSSGPTFFLPPSVSICTLLGFPFSFRLLLSSFFLPDPLGRIQRHENTNIGRAQRILMHVFARVDVYFSSYFQQLVFSNGTVTIFILARHTAYYRRGDHLRSEFSPSLSFSSLTIRRVN